MGRPEQPLDPAAGPIQEFAADLRELRRQAGNLGYRSLARRAGYSASTLSAAASGRTLPSLAVTLAYAGACGGDLAEWEARWQKLATAAEQPARANATPPRQLPPDPHGFTGRAAELTVLDGLLDAAEPRSAVVISAVAGTGGVGKTALAVHWAHRVARRFPDGQLYVDLRGYDPEQPLDPADVLAGFLRALGVPGGQIPFDAAERAARYRTLLAGRRMLVVLDNARSADQVRLLLPGTPSCFVLVTSRDSLAGLVARHGARRLDLDLLPAAEAVALLRTLVGPRIDAEPAAAAALVQRCARLPLALRLAGQIAAARPLSTVDDLVTGLDELLGERTAIRAVFSWSYRRLPDPAARLFRLLGLHPGRDLDGYAAAALAGLDLDTTTRLIDVLARAHLVEPGRLKLHDLLRAYAAELAADDPDRRPAVGRLLDHYLAAASVAMDTLSPAEHHRRPQIPRPDGPLPPVGEPAAARVWLDAELPNLVATAAHATADGWPEYAGRLAATLSYHLENGCHYAEALAIYGDALAAARAQGGPAAQADAYHRIGNIMVNLGRHADAAEHYQRALALRRELGDPALVGRTLNNLGNLYQRWGRHAEAAEHFRQALASLRAQGDRYGEAVVLCNLGDLHVSSGGPYREALEYYERAAALCREVGDRSGEGTVLACAAGLLVRFGRCGEAAEAAIRGLALVRDVGDRYGECYARGALGLARLGLGYPAQALADVTAALQLARTIEDRMAECDTLAALGRVCLRAGRRAEAVEHYRTALAIARRSGYRSREIRARNGLGEALRAGGELAAAADQHDTALRLAREQTNLDEQARALDGLGDIRYRTGRPDLARAAWRSALATYAALAVPEADELRRRLDQDAVAPAAR